MSICSNCYSNCAEIQSDKCVKYTGVDIAVLGIQNGDSINYVTAAIIGFLTSTLDASGIKYELEPENVCTIISDGLTDCTDITQKDISNAIAAALCGVDTRLTAAEATIDGIETTYTPDCVPGITGTEGTQVVVQAVIDHLCSVATDLDALELTVSTNYVLIADINTYIANYLSGLTEESTVGFKDRMVPYTVVEYYGPLTVFDGTGGGLDLTGSGGSDWTQIYLCNGENGTPDKRGRVAVGATTGMGGGLFPSETDPAVTGNPDYALYTPEGVNIITLSTTQMPSHTHTGTTDTDPGHVHSATAAGPYVGPSITGGGGFDGGDNVFRERTVTMSSAGSHSHTLTSDSSGGGQSHNNIQPSLGCYYIMYIPTV